MNGTPTSYMDTFKNAYDHLSDKLNLKPDQDIWASFGPYSSQLDVDEAEDINKTWDQIGSLIGKEVDEVK
jgi:alanyl-tRNA synthetase